MRVQTAVGLGELWGLGGTLRTEEATLVQPEMRVLQVPKAVEHWEQQQRLAAGCFV